MIDEEIRKNMEEALSSGNYDEALKLSRILDEQILEYLKAQKVLKNTKIMV